MMSTNIFSFGWFFLQLQSEEQTAQAAARGTPPGECKKNKRMKAQLDAVAMEPGDDNFSPAVERKSSMTLVTISQT